MTSPRIAHWFSVVWVQMSFTKTCWQTFLVCQHGPLFQGVHVLTYQVNTVPPTCHWVEVEPGVEFQRVENYVDKGGDGKRADTVVTFHLQSSAADGPTRIDAFVDAAYAYYKVLKGLEIYIGG